MKTARELLNDSDGGQAIAFALEYGGLGLNALLELVAQRARQEALEMAAKVCEGERCKESCVHLTCDALMLVENDILGIPTTPGDGEAGR